MAIRHRLLREPLTVLVVAGMLSMLFAFSLGTLASTASAQTTVSGTDDMCGGKPMPSGDHCCPNGVPIPDSAMCTASGGPVCGSVPAGYHCCPDGKVIPSFMMCTASSPPPTTACNSAGAGGAICPGGGAKIAPPGAWMAAAASNR